MRHVVIGLGLAIAGCGDDVTRGPADEVVAKYAFKSGPGVAIEPGEVFVYVFRDDAGYRVTTGIAGAGDTLASRRAIEWSDRVLDARWNGNWLRFGDGEANQVTFPNATDGELSICFGLHELTDNAYPACAAWEAPVR